MDNRVVVYTTDSEVTAVIVKDRLVAEGIDTVILDAKDHVSEVVGGFELYVHPEDAERAKIIIADSAE